MVKKPLYSELEAENATLKKLIAGYAGAITELTEQNKTLESTLLKLLDQVDGWESLHQDDIDNAYGTIK